MPKFTDPDEEGVVQQWTPTCIGQVLTVRYFIYTRLLFDEIPYEKCQRLANEVRIYKLPEFLYSELPTGFDRDEDPFEYVNGGTRKLMEEADKRNDDKNAEKIKP